MSFMEPETTNKIDWWRIETTHGTWFVPRMDAMEVSPIDETCTDEHIEAAKHCAARYVECGKDGIEKITLVKGYGVRSSASGYLDCTDWTVYRTKREAKKAYSREKRESRGEY